MLLKHTNFWPRNRIYIFFIVPRNKAIGGSASDPELSYPEWSQQSPFVTWQVSPCSDGPLKGAAALAPQPFTKQGRDPITALNTAEPSKSTTTKKVRHSLLKKSPKKGIFKKFFALTKGTWASLNIKDLFCAVTVMLFKKGEKFSTGWISLKHFL